MIAVAAAVLFAAEPFADEPVALVERHRADVVREHAEDDAAKAGRLRPLDGRLKKRAAVRGIPPNRFRRKLS